MTLLHDFETEFYSGTTSPTASVPFPYPVALAGRPFLVDTLSGEWQHLTVPLLRQASDQSREPGEQSLTNLGLWRRKQDSWHEGAGQTFLDRDDSSRNRFNRSLHVDVWTKNQVSLLPARDGKTNLTQGARYVVVAGSRLYALSANATAAALSYTTDLAPAAPTWTQVTGMPAQQYGTIATDGYSVWVQAAGANGIYVTDTTTGAASVFCSSVVTGPIGFVNGRLLVANDQDLYNLTASGALPASPNVLDHPNAGFRWVGFAGGAGHIYAAGYSGDKSVIYRTAVKADGTALDVASIAGTLPDGEIVRSIYGYLGFILIGSDLGVRFCQADAQGNLVVGNLIPTEGPVRCFEGQDRFVWFGWDAYIHEGTTYSGLGRIDLRTFTDEDRTTPAYATDLMGTSSPVTSVVTFQDKRVYTGNNIVFVESATAKMYPGVIDSGYITYGLPDTKTAMSIDVRYDGTVGDGIVYTSISVNGGTFSRVGTFDPFDPAWPSPPFPLAELEGDTFEIRHEIYVNNDLNVSPILHRHTLKAAPHGDPVLQIRVPLQINVSDLLDSGPRDRPPGDMSFIKSLWESRQTVSYQEGDESYSVRVDDFEFRARTVTDKGMPIGTCIVTLKEASL